MRFGAFIADYETSWPRAACALAAGAAAPPILFLLVLTIMSPEEPAAQRAAWMIVTDFLEVFAFVFVQLFIVLIGLGGPVWMLMHALRLRGWGAAILGGAAAATTFAVLMAYLFEDSVKGHPFRDLLLSYFPKFIPVGALIGLIVWAVAYRRPAPPPSAVAVQ
jgi:hypothetical protein